MIRKLVIVALVLFFGTLALAAGAYFFGGGNEQQTRQKAQAPATQTKWSGRGEKVYNLGFFTADRGRLILKRITYSSLASTYTDARIEMLYDSPDLLSPKPAWLRRENLGQTFRFSYSSRTEPVRWQAPKVLAEADGDYRISIRLRRVLSGRLDDPAGLLMIINGAMKGKADPVKVVVQARAKTGHSLGENAAREAKARKKAKQKARQKSRKQQQAKKKQ